MQLGLELLQVDLPEGPGSLIGHLLCRQGLHALLKRRQDCHLIVQHLIRDQLLVPLSGRGLPGAPSRPCAALPSSESPGPPGSSEPLPPAGTAAP